MLLTFNKFHGAGNDFILLDIRNGDPGFPVETIKFLCDRRLGIGADGLITLDHDEKYPFSMRYYNSDGNESTMCGNGGRCIALFANQLGLGDREIHFNAIDGDHTAIILEKGQNTARIRLKMKEVDVIESFNGYHTLNTGSPHYVCYKDKVNDLDIRMEGRKVRYSETFRAEGINVNFVERLEAGLFVRTYERGVEDETLSCGTGVTASALVEAFTNPLCISPVTIRTLGGNLWVHFTKAGSSFKDIWLEGPAVQVYTGNIEI